MSEVEKDSALPGKRIKVEFEAPGATGYQWSLDPSETRVRVTQRETVPNSGSFGGASRQVFVLEPLEAGEFDVNFILARPWEGRTKKTRTVHIKSD